MSKEPWLLAIRAKLEELRDLKPNWDSYRALPPDPEAVEQAIKFAELVSKAGASKPHVAPCNDGRIGFEWTGALEVEIDSNGVIEYLTEGITSDWQDIVDMLNSGRQV